MVRSRWSSVLGHLRVWLGVAMVVAGWSAADAGDVIRKLKLDESAPVVGLFDGIESRQLQVKLVVSSPNDAVVSIKNKTDAPLTVALPKAAVGIPILPQFLQQQGNTLFGNNGGNQLNNNPIGNNNGQANQAVGGQMQPMGNQQFPNPGANGNQPQFPGGNLFSIPPEKIVQLKMRTVCLNYGNPDPNVGVKYELRKLESVISDPVLRQLLEEYSVRVDQDVMQAAAWHLANGLSWNQVANLPDPSVPFPVGATRFAPTTVKAAQDLVKYSEEQAAKREPEPAAPEREIVRPVATTKIR